MSIIAAARRAAAIVAATASALLLSGCLLTSETLLVSPAEAEPIFADSFALQPYKEAEGVFVFSTDAPGIYTRQPDNGYLDPDGQMTAYFLARDDGRYLMALNATDGAMYGLVDRRGDLLEIAIVLDGDAASLAAAGIPIPDGVHFEDGGAIIDDRAALDAAIALIADGTLETSALLAWVGDGPAPPQLVASGDWYAAP